MKWLAVIYACASGFFFLPNQELRPVQEMMFHVSSMVVFSVGCVIQSKAIKFDKVHLWLIGLFGWFMFLWIREEMWGWNVVINFMFGLMAYFTFIRTLKKEDLGFVLKGLMWVAFIATLYLLGQYLGWDACNQWVKNPNGHLIVPKCSFFGLEPVLGVWYAILTPVLLAFSPVALCLVLPILLSYSSGAILAVVCGILFFYWFQKRIIFWALIIPLCLGGFLYFWKIDTPLGMQKSRFMCWGLVAQDGIQKFWGYGPDTFRNPVKEGANRYFKHSYDDGTVRARKQGDQWMLNLAIDKEFMEYTKDGNHPLDWWDHPHQEVPVWLLYEGGVPALVLFIGFAYSLWMRFFRSKRNMIATAGMASLISVFITGLTQFPFHLARTACMIPVIGAMLFISMEE